MAKKSKKAASPKARNAAAKAPKRQAASATAVGEGGPVTLAEARALAGAGPTSKAMRRVGAGGAATSAAGPSPDAVAEEREHLKQQQDAERVRRLREYTDTMTIMKQRGARAPDGKALAKARKGSAAVRAGGSFKPLQVFAEGDSWFDYPPFLFHGGIIPRLQDRLGVPILNMASAGDEVRLMLGVEERIRLVKTLVDGCPAGGPWDVLLFSGGGNDIVDNPMALWVRDWDPTIDAKHHLDSTRFAAALAIVRAGYEDLIALRNKHSPDTHIVLHGYDFAIPDGRGVCGLGPWMKPTFDLHNFPDRAKAQEVVTEMLRQFAAMVKSMTIAKAVTYIETQGTLAPKTSSWHNELHPSSDGFDKFADMFQAHLKGLFPDRVA